MSPQETDLLKKFLQQLEHVQLSQRDAEAEALIQASAAKQKDALYLLVQKSILQEQALIEAQAQIHDLQSQNATLKSQLAEQNSHKGFLGNALSGWGNSAATQAAPVNPASPYPYSQNQRPGLMSSMQGGSFLGTMAATAAGAVAGAFLFQGISNMMSGPSQHAADSHSTQANLSDSGQQDLLPGYFDEPSNSADAGLEASADYDVDSGSDY